MIVTPSPPAAPLVGLTRLYAYHTSRLEISNDFASTTRVIPLQVVRPAKLNDDAPSVQSHYRTFNACLRTRQEGGAPCAPRPSLRLSAAAVPSPDKVRPDGEGHPQHPPRRLAGSPEQRATNRSAACTAKACARFAPALRAASALCPRCQRRGRQAGVNHGLLSVPSRKKAGRRGVAHRRHRRSPAHGTSPWPRRCLAHARFACR